MQMQQIQRRATFGLFTWRVGWCEPVKWHCGCFVLRRLSLSPPVWRPLTVLTPRPRVAQWCYDPFTCSQRMSSTISLVSSQLPNNGGSRWPSMLRLPGIFDYDPRRNPLAGANLVQVRLSCADPAPC